MAEQNPYESPNASLKSPSTAPGELYEPRHCPASAGVNWIGEGFSLFKSNAGMWLAITLVYAVIYFAVGAIPFIGYLWWIISSVFAGGLLYAAREADVGEGPEIEHIFAGFKRGAASLLALGVLTAVAYLIAFVVSAVLALLITGSLGSINLGMFQSEQFDPSLFLALLPALFVFLAIGFAFFVPITMCQLFAPALIIFHDVPVIDAMKMSFAASTRNLGSLTVWGLLGIVVWIAGALLLMLGLLVAFPVLLLSTYAAYKQIFLADE